jgi:hypothetical protein
MKTPCPPLCLLAFAVALLPAAQAETITATVTPSDPAKPCVLKIRVARGAVHVHGSDTKDITVVSDAAPENKVRKDGLRVLTSAASYTFVEKNNVVILESDNGHESSTTGDFQITVPRTTSLVITDLWGGEITCAGVSGDVDIRSHNGQVRLDDVLGGATVETMNGEIYAKVAELHENHPLCFTSMNGKVTVTLPAAIKANVRLRTQNGAILTDFDERALITKTEIAARSARNGQLIVAGDDVISDQARDAIRDAGREAGEAAREAARAIHEAAAAMREGLAEGHANAGMPMIPMPPLPPLPPMTGGKIISGTLNGGGVDIQAATMNGDVVIRKM